MWIEWMHLIWLSPIKTATEDEQTGNTMAKRKWLKWHEVTFPQGHTTGSHNLYKVGKILQGYLVKYNTKMEHKINTTETFNNAYSSNPSA